MDIPKVVAVYLHQLLTNQNKRQKRNEAPSKIAEAKNMEN
jgi:hypothetical protein